jgi:hypothetical protein
MSTSRTSASIAAAFLACALWFATAHTASPGAFSFYDRGPYRDGVPRPSQVLGYEPGSFHTSFGNMERYVDALVRTAPDVVARVSFGRTTEFRERALLVITSPENHRRLDEIRDATARLADPRRAASAAEVERLIHDTPVTVWLNYSIHGDESASFEAMAQVAYQLAAGEDQATRAIRDRCVVLLNLAHNPDGHERFVTWINALGSGNPDPLAIEQQAQQPWGIGGRTNHYQVDLNRDALAMSQIESRQLAAEFMRWRPQVFVDHHGQTASYFFAPPASPINAVLPREDVRKWTEIFGHANAAAFDRYGWNYYVRDVFDLYYPGYWDSWPTLHGAIGMTYETDGGGNLAIRRDDETVVTLLDGIERHFTASLATCTAAAQHREERLRDFRRFAVEAISEGRRGPVRGYAFELGSDPPQAAALAELLMRHGIEVQWAPSFRAGAAQRVGSDHAAAAKAAPKGKNAVPAEAPAARVEPRSFRGAFVVDLAQPMGRLARTLLERDAPMDADFTRVQLDKYQRNIKRGAHAHAESYDFYDVTAWSLSIAFGVPVYALRGEPPRGVALRAPALEEVPSPADSVRPIGVPLTARVSRVGPLELADEHGHVVLDLHGGIDGGPATTAYVWSCEGEGALRLALRLMQEDFRVATSTRPLRASTRDFPRGSFIVRIERNPETLHTRIAALARDCGVSVLALHSAYADLGDTGVGSESVRSLKRPRVAILVGDPVSPTAYGWLWFLFERRLGVRFTALRDDQIAGAELERYNVIIVPDGNAGALASALGDGGIARLKPWVEHGGVLVCLDDAAEFPTLKSVKLSSARAVGVRTKEKKDDEDEADAKPDSLREEERRPQYVPGTIFSATLDPRHFLCFGYDEPRLPVLLQGRLFLKPSKEGVNPAMFDSRPLAVSGWSWPETERRLMNTAYAVDEPSGAGHVVMMIGSPAFRLFWRSTERMLLNAVIYGPSLD